MKRRKFYKKGYRKELLNNTPVYKTGVLLLTVLCMCPYLKLLFNLAMVYKDKGSVVLALVSLLTIPIATIFWTWEYTDRKFNFNPLSYWVMKKMYGSETSDENNADNVTTGCENRANSKAFNTDQKETVRKVGKELQKNLEHDVLSTQNTAEKLCYIIQNYKTLNLSIEDVKVYFAYYVARENRSEKDRL